MFLISEVTNEDNMSLMARYPDKFFDLACDDPPYFSGPEKRVFYGKRFSSIGVKRLYEATETWSLPTVKYFNEVKRVSKNQIIWGANYFDFIETPHKTPRRNELSSWIKDHPVGWIVWDKCNEASSFNDFELAWTSFDIPTVVYKFMWNGMLQGKSMNNGHIMQGNKKLNQKRIHPTEKPILMYKWQFSTYCRQGQRILSNYVGSGADRIAAFDLDIDFYGCELSKTHFINQEKRFQTHILQPNLFKTKSIHGISN